jgi:hypothetical protein
MKKIITLAVIGLFFLSCSNDHSSSNPNPLPETPQAKAAFDNSNFGIYKGVFVGSSGVISVNIKNDGTISAKLILDGTTYNFTTTGNVIQNQVIVKITFKSGNMSFDFAADADGSNAIISNIEIEGHPLAHIEILKEKSYAIIKCYQGTYSGTDSGVFNVYISNGYIYGLIKPEDSSQSAAIYGTVTNDITISASIFKTTISGSVNGDNINGTWIDTEDPIEKGTWSGHRTL